MKPLIVAAAIFALCPPGRADPAPAIHYAPAENLEHIDVTLIDTAKHEIDMAAYVLTDWPVVQALTRAADRGEETPNRIVVTLASWRRFGWKGHC
jgi:phosphatidylserine/phosphatidylglycerophosphate/cardiolipin synthase-like enzyme